jgi:hypothetical protein
VTHSTGGRSRTDSRELGRVSENLGCNREAPAFSSLHLRQLVAVLVALAILAAVIAAIALANTSTATCLRSFDAKESKCPGRLIAKFAADIAPNKLPTHTLSPAALKLLGKISTEDGAHPSALRKLTLDLDRNIAINAKGFPICHQTGVETYPYPHKNLRNVCKSAIVGAGNADFEVAIPEQSPIREQSPVTIYNGGMRQGAMTLFAVASINVPVPNQIVARVKIKKIRKGPYGTEAVAEIPKIAGGRGSVLDFKFTLRKIYPYMGKRVGYFEAKCPTGALKFTASLLFMNEAHTPQVPSQTTLKGALIDRCRPKR